MPNAPDDYTISVTESTTGKHLTAGAALASTFTVQYVGNTQNAGGGPVLIKSTATASAPANWAGARRIDMGDGFVGVTINDLWPGSTNTYLWAIGPVGAVISFASA